MYFADNLPGYISGFKIDETLKSNESEINELSNEHWRAIYNDRPVRFSWRRKSELLLYIFKLFYCLDSIKFIAICEWKRT
jgi:hypothetical protein